MMTSIDSTMSKSDLNELVRSAWRDLGGVRFLPVEFAFGSISQFSIDPVQIRKVVTNLLLNARDSVGEKGRVQVETSMHASTQVELRVCDDGCGMDDHFVKTRLFRPFQSTKKKGLGIGLFHARLIVEAHRGEIEVESSPGKGSIFRVLLPLKNC